jgi:hypothetical protein
VVYPILQKWFFAIEHLFGSWGHITFPALCKATEFDTHSFRFYDAHRPQVDWKGANIQTKGRNEWDPLANGFVASERCAESL